MKVFGVVYLIWNMVNGKKYVGQTVQPLKKRFKQHARCKKSVLYNAIRKYGVENFRYGVIKSCASKEEMDYWEKYFIVALKTKFPYGYNLTDGGEGISGYVRTEETLKKMSEAQMGKHHTAETCAKISASSKGKTLSPETCAKISVAKKGKYIGEKNPQYGKIRTPEMRSKSSATQRHYSPYKNLIAELDAHNLSYAALAKLMGFASMSHISDKMRCKKKFISKDALKLEEIFGKPAEYLLKRKSCAETAKIQRSPFKNLLDELDVHKLSYRRLAELLDISDATISRKMSGKYNFTAKDKIRLEEIFGKPADYLLEYDDD